MRVKLHCELGMSIQVEGVDWVKPVVFAEASFDDVPSDAELEQKWDWLWTTQVAPQAEQLLDMLKAEMRKRLGVHEDPPSQDRGSGRPPPPPAPTPSAPPVDIAPGAAYG